MPEIIKVDRLSKPCGSLHVANSFSLSVEKGTVFGLLGANGAGENTTIECILRTKKADDRHVSILGMNPHDGCKQPLEHMGIQFQETNYQSKIIVSELREMTASLYRHIIRPEDLLRQLGVWNKTRSLVGSLPGGEHQRLFLMLTLVPSPEVVLLDGSTAGLDVRVRWEVWRTLLDLKEEELTISLISHFMDEVKALCDCICTLKKGTAVFYGTASEALKVSSRGKLEDAYSWFTNEKGDYHETIQDHVENRIKTFSTGNRYGDFRHHRVADGTDDSGRHLWEPAGL